MVEPDATDERSLRRRIHRQAASITLSVVPFGVVFGVAAADAGLGYGEAAGFSVVVFAGSAQFAAVRVLADGGTALTAIAAGLLLNLRSLAFGALLAPVLTGRLGTRALFSHLIVDESTAVAMAQTGQRWRRYGLVTTGVAIFVAWNLATVLGVSLGALGDDFVTDWGLDAAAPAAFLVLLWPRLIGATAAIDRRIAFAGAIVAAIAVPLTPAGVPILLGGIGVLAARAGADVDVRADRDGDNP